jgi:hypothetical protein
VPKLNEQHVLGKTRSTTFCNWTFGDRHLQAFDHQSEEANLLGYI